MTENSSFKGTEWRKLETAIETISDMIADQIFRLNNALLLDSPRPDLVKDIRAEIKRLNQEIKLCYDSARNHDVLTKACTVYAPQLRRQAHI